MAVLVGLDVGASGTRDLAVNPDGAVVAEATSRYVEVRGVGVDQDVPALELGDRGGVGHAVAE